MAFGWDPGQARVNIRLWLRLRANFPSGSSSGSASLHYICILTWETFQIKKHHSRSNGVSLFALEYTWHCSLAFRRQSASDKVSGAYQRKKRGAIWTRVMLYFYPFQVAKTIYQLVVAWFKDTRVTQKSVPVGRVGRSVGRESCWSVGLLKLIKIIIFGRNSFLRPPTSLEC